jgi:hypothetical protein
MRAAATEADTLAVIAAEWSQHHAVMLAVVVTDSSEAARPFMADSAAVVTSAVDLAAATVVDSAVAVMAVVDTGKSSRFFSTKPDCFGGRAFLCAQHGRTLTGASPVTNWSQ